MSINLFLNGPNTPTFRIASQIRDDTGREYEVTERLAAGGNAVVHECIERIGGQKWAAKFHLSNGAERLTRFRQEICLLRALSHDQLMSCSGSGVVGAFSGPRRLPVTIEFVIMPLADANLRDVVKSPHERPLPEEYVAQFKGLAEALGVLHTRAIHRDIKPENVLVQGETWLLSDFGLCRSILEPADITQVGERLGPRYWMSPEAMNRVIGNDDEISKQSDVFQMASVFWFVVTGRHPTGIVMESDWPGPPNLFPILKDALSHDPAKRPADGNDLAGRLHKVTT